MKVRTPLLLFAIIFFCSLNIITFCNQSSYAHISKKNITKQATFKLKTYNTTQGGTISKDYYIYTECKNACSNGKGAIVFVKRSNCQEAGRFKGSGWGHVSGVTHKWGSNYAGIYSSSYGGASSGIKACYSISPLKEANKSNCVYPPSMSVYKEQGVATSINGHTFKVGGRKGTNTYIGVSGGGVSTISSNTVGGLEPENIGIDHSNGEVYISYNRNSPDSVRYYKIDSSVFSKYTGKNGAPTKNPVCNGSSAADKDGSSGSNGNNRGKNPYINRKPKNPIADIAAKADTNGVMSTNFFGNLQDDGKGCGVWLILNIVLTVLTFGVIIAATVGMLLSAITYMTAKDSPEKVAKAKKRILDIIIGLFMYAAMWSILEWLLPGGILNTGEICKPASSSDTTSFSSNKSNGKVT